MILKSIFSSWLAYGELDIDNDRVEKYCRSQFSSDKVNTGFLDVHNPEMSELIDRMTEKFNELHLGIGLSINYKQDIIRYWANEDYAHPIVEPHSHPDGFFSGVYYVNTGDIDTYGRLHIMNPVREMFHVVRPYMVNQQNEYWSEAHVVEPKRGMFVIFPSWLVHYVDFRLEPNENLMSGKNRLSVAFDTAILKR